MKIDENVKPAVRYISQFEGLEIVGSCGGHKNPKHYQAKEGHFYIDFIGCSVESLDNTTTPMDEVEAFVRFLSECEEVDSLEVVMKATITGKMFYRLQGTLEDIENLIPGDE